MSGLGEEVVELFGEEVGVGFGEPPVDEDGVGAAADLRVN